jgi:hypothetical protein
MAQTYIYNGRFKNTSDILYTWDGTHLYKGRFTNVNDILYTFDGKYLYKGRFTNINDVLYSVHGNNVYRGRYNDISKLVVNFIASSFSIVTSGFLGTSDLLHANANKIPKAKITLFIN